MLPSVQPLGDSAAIVSWTGTGDDDAANQSFRLAELIRRRPEAAEWFLVPAFATLTIHYPVLRMSFDAVRTLVLAAATTSEEFDPTPGRMFEIPVCYEPPFGPDLSEIALLHRACIQEIIEQHAAAAYQVRMIGFSPGFPYLSGLPSRLATPRRSTPRLKVPVGSVAIGGSQTGIYTMESPGGWNIIGRTPMTLFLPELDPPTLLTPGDRVQFVPMTTREFQNWNKGS